MDNKTTKNSSLGRTDAERKAVIDAMLEREKSPTHRRNVSAIQDLDELIEKAKKRDKESIEDEGDDSSDSESEIEVGFEVDALQEHRKKMRGDFTDSNPAPLVAGTAPPEPRPVTEVSTKVKPNRSKRPTWRDASETYLTKTFKSEQYPTAKEFFAILKKKAGTDSPFDIGVGQNSGSLFARDTGEKVTLKMIQGFVTEIRKQQ